MGAWCRDRQLTRQAVREILRNGMQYSIPDWIAKRRGRPPSIQILADKQLHYWPQADRICSVTLKDWPVKRWGQAICLGEVQITSPIVVLYLEGTKNWMDIPPIKNSLQALCKVIRNHSLGVRIFVSNHLPQITSSPVQQPVSASNFTLQLAVRSVERAVGGGVFELSIFEHFMLKKGKMAKDLFVQADKLSQEGCLVFRECVLHEVGVKSYWFEETNGQE